MPNYSEMVQVRRGSGAEYGAPRMSLGRSQFDRSHQHKTTFDAGYLVPYFVDEVLPGDTFTCKLLAFARIFSPVGAPVMDNIELTIDFFYVPTRLLWDNWEAFLGAHDEAGAQDTTYTIPRVSDGNNVIHDAGNTSAGRTMAYMGLPDGLSTTTEFVNCLPLRAYVLIYNEWYRDQNLIDQETEDTGDGPSSAGKFALKKSAKKHDYFTSCLPYLQKGDAQAAQHEVKVDLGATGEIGVWSTTLASYQHLETDGAAGTPVEVDATAAVMGERLYVDVSINALREAAAIQRLLERDARGGTRLPELIRAHFGVTVPDYRVQRPEYLGGGRGYLNISPIANTSSTATENQGELHGTGAGTLTASWAKSFVEHGYVLGILRARADVTYQQGVDRMFSRQSKYDFYWPELSMLGEQPVYNKELWIDGSATDDNVFGYQERFGEYRYKKSLVTGAFNSDAAGSLDFWHLAEDFATRPALNQTFIEDQSPLARITTVDTEDDFVIDGRFELRCARPLPVRPVPTLAPARF